MLKGAKGDLKMTSWTKGLLGCAVLAGAILLFAQTPAGAAVIVQYQMEIAPSDGLGNATGAYLPVSASYSDLATGTYLLRVGVKVTGNSMGYTPTSGVYSGKLLGAGLQQYSFNISDSTNGSKVAFSDQGAIDAGGDTGSATGALFGQSWPTSPAITAANMATTFGSNIIGTTGNVSRTNGYLRGFGGNTQFDVGAETGAENPSTVYSGYTKMLIGGGPITSGTPTYWSTVLTTEFNFTGNAANNAPVVLTLIPSLTGTNVIKGTYATAAGSDGHHGMAIVNPDSAPSVSISLQAPVGTWQELYDTNAAAGLAQNAAMAKDPVLSWHHPVGGWWNPTAYMNLDGSQAASTSGGGAITTWKWTLTDVDGQHTYVCYGETAQVTVQELSNAGFTKPAAPLTPAGPWAFGTLSLTVYDGAEGASNWGNSGTTPLLLPEPASMFVLALGAVGALLRRRRK
jgi:hypothetical protein